MLLWLNFHKSLTRLRNGVGKAGFYWLLVGLAVIKQYLEVIMLTIKSPIKKLSSAIALGLVAGAASASTTLYDTYKYIFDSQGQVINGAQSGAEGLDTGNEWAAGYFFINPQTCPNGCDITKASVLIESSLYDAFRPSSFSGVKLEIYTNNNIGPNPTDKVPGTSLFQLTTPVQVQFDGNFGTRVEFTASSQDPNSPALLQPNTEYWLKLTNISQSPSFGWFYNGLDKPGEYWASSAGGRGFGSPYIFDITGDVRPGGVVPAPVPIPGAVWLMASALLSLRGLRNKKSA